MLSKNSSELGSDVSGGEPDDISDKSIYFSDMESVINGTNGTYVKNLGWGKIFKNLRKILPIL